MWEDARRVDNGTQIRRLTELALHHGPSIDFASYYERQIAAGEACQVKSWQLSLVLFWSQ